MSTLDLDKIDAIKVDLEAKIGTEYSLHPLKKEKSFSLGSCEIINATNEEITAQVKQRSVGLHAEVGTIITLDRKGQFKCEDGSKIVLKKNNIEFRLFNFGIGDLLVFEKQGRVEFVKIEEKNTKKIEDLFLQIPKAMEDFRVIYQFSKVIENPGAIKNIENLYEYLSNKKELPIEQTLDLFEYLSQ